MTTSLPLPTNYQSNSFGILVENPDPPPSLPQCHILSSLPLGQDHHGQLGTGDHQPWILHRIPVVFASLLPCSQLSPGDSSHQGLLQQEADALLLKGTLETIPSSYKGLPLLPYPKEGQRALPHFKPLSAHTFSRKFKFHRVTLALIILSLSQGAWFAALNIKDACFHISIHPAHRKFL